MGCVVSEKDELIQRVEEAKESLRLALQDEQYADSDHVEIAIERVRIAQDYLNSLYKQAKLVMR